MEKTIQILDSLNENVGKVFAWTSLFMMLVICLDVVLRYLFSFSYIWITELEIYLFALCFLFGAGYTLKHDKHVRVDLFYDKWSDKRKAWVDLMGTILFLFPWCIVSIIASWKYAVFSFSFRESSPQAGGLPALYVLKFCLMMGFVFLLLQGVSMALRSLMIIRGQNQDA